MSTFIARGTHCYSCDFGKKINPNNNAFKSGHTLKKFFLPKEPKEKKLQCGI
jgi:hypothetical protein